MAGHTRQSIGVAVSALLLTLLVLMMSTEESEAAGMEFPFDCICEISNVTCVGNCMCDRVGVLNAGVRQTFYMEHCSK